MLWSDEREGEEWLGDIQEVKILSHHQRNPEINFQQLYLYLCQAFKISVRLWQWEAGEGYDVLVQNVTLVA